MSGDCVDWFFGRGLSISCGLTWSVPEEWKGLSRTEQIALIKPAVREAMGSPNICLDPIHRLLNILETQTDPRWRHRFITTNWDHLLQQALISKGWAEQPDWLDETHVYHLNGTVEELAYNGNRSPFLLESDPPDERNSTLEADTAFNRIIWNRNFVVVGMSFECEMDRFLLHSLGKIEDELPIGESSWLIINPDESAGNIVANRIRNALPRANVASLAYGFNEWITAGAPELSNWGVFIPQQE
jgi:hypothetical protein